MYKEEIVYQNKNRPATSKHNDPQLQQQQPAEKLLDFI